jgi:STE24 endopeptidase
MAVLTFFFLVFFFATLAAQCWLAARHWTHVRAHRAAVPPAFATTVALADHQKAADYSVVKTRFGIIELLLLDGALLLALTLGGGIGLVDQWTGATFGTGYVASIVVVVAVLVFSSLAGLPFELYRTYVIEERFGFNQTPLRTFIVDRVKGFLLGAALGIPFLLAVLWFLTHAGPLWWLYTWAAWVAFSIALMLAYPKWLAPLFNRFTPLDAGETRERIESLMQRCGFAANGLFVMDGSKRSSHGNAYFTGFGRTKRIVFFDTLLKRLTIDEIEAVLAHELGHYKRGHIPKLLVTRFLIALVVMGILGAVIDQPGFFTALGLGDTNGLPSLGARLALFFLIVPVFTFALAPLASVMSRQHEFEADAYAASVTGARHLEAALVKLYRDNASTLTPDPLHSLVYDSHPSAAIRIAHLRQHQALATHSHDAG